MIKSVINLILLPKDLTFYQNKKCVHRILEKLLEYL